MDDVAPGTSSAVEETELEINCELANRKLIKDGSVLKRIGSLLLKALIAASLFGCYALTSSLAEIGPRMAAHYNARTVWELQEVLHLPSEMWLQSLVLPHVEIIRVLNEYYALAHFPATLLFALWIATNHREGWVRVWASLTMMTLFCLAIDAVFPVAPPRLYPQLQMVDTLARYGPNLYGNHAVSQVADQYGAMPSLHFGWSVFVAWGVIRYAAHLRKLRWVVILHPLITLAAVTLTANHYWLDCIMAAMFVPAGIWITDAWFRLTSPRLRARLRRPLIVVAIPISLFGLLSIATIFV